MERSISIGPVQPRKVVKGGPTFSKLFRLESWLKWPGYVALKKMKQFAQSRKVCMKDI